MTNKDMELLLSLVAKLEKENPQFSVVLTDVPKERMEQLYHDPADFKVDHDDYFTPLEVQLDCCLDDKENDVLYRN